MEDLQRIINERVDAWIMDGGEDDAPPQLDLELQVALGKLARAELRRARMDMRAAAAQDSADHAWSHAFLLAESKTEAGRKAEADVDGTYVRVRHVLRHWKYRAGQAEAIASVRKRQVQALMQPAVGGVSWDR